MEKQNIISYQEAIRRARNLKYIPNAYFTLYHLTCNFAKKTTEGMSKTEKCRVRKALNEDTFTLDGDLYFTYEDIDTGKAKMCFKCLMRFIAFPPNYELLKIKYSVDE
ncbi:MAG: hypothetical protein LBN95_06485 [Prevotellaceae bacterium]|jgi:hypothetical protein|nr:hypothetical protein [Prevotellaceae bacterium]